MEKQDQVLKRSQQLNNTTLQTTSAQVAVVLLLGTSFELSLAANRRMDFILDKQPGSRVEIMLRNARLAKLLDDMKEREEEMKKMETEEEEPDLPDYDLESLGGIEGLQTALR